MEALRLFTAVRPDDLTIAACVAFRDGLAASLPGGFVRWAKPDNYHVTLQFLGDVAVGQVDVIVAAMHEAIRTATTRPGSIEAIELAVAGVGAFPTPRRARTVWLGIRDPSNRLRKLESSLRDALRTAGVAYDRKTFRPHLTLGYVRHASGDEARALAAAIESAQGSRFESTFTASRVLLVRSTLAPGGSRYESIAFAEFAAHGA